MLDKEMAINIAEKFTEAVIKEFPPYAIIVFGSYINGNPHENSDIDVGVVFNGFTGDRRLATSRLWRLRRGIRLDIEPHLLDFANDQSGFVKYIYNTGQIIYQN